jgi:phasin family protein
LKQWPKIYVAVQHRSSLDILKRQEEQEVMSITPEKFALSNKATVDTLFGFAEAQFTAIERLAQLNLGVARAALTRTAEHVKSTLDASDPQEILALSAGYAQPTLEKAVSYGKSVYDVAAQTQSTVRGLAQAQAAHLNKSLVTLLDNVPKGAPFGSEAGVSAVKSAMAAVTSAYDTFSRIAQQATEVVDVSFQNPAHATKAKPRKG